MTRRSAGAGGRTANGSTSRTRRTTPRCRPPPPPARRPGTVVMAPGELACDARIDLEWLARPGGERRTSMHAKCTPQKTKYVRGAG